MNGTPLRWPPLHLVAADVAFCLIVAQFAPPPVGYVVAGAVLFLLLVLDSIPGVAGVCCRMMALPMPLLVVQKLHTFPLNVVTIAVMIGVVLVDLWGETRAKDRHPPHPATPPDPSA